MSSAHLGESLKPVAKEASHGIPVEPTPGARALVQKLLAEQPPEPQAVMGEHLAERTQRRPDETNEAVALLVQRGHAACDSSQGRRSYAFTTVRLTPAGRAPCQPPSRS
jgi:hypothetical protein